MIDPMALILLSTRERCEAQALRPGMAVMTPRGTTAVVRAMTMQQGTSIQLKAYEDEEPCWHTVRVGLRALVLTDEGFVPAETMPLWTPLTICRREHPERLLHCKLREHVVTHLPMMLVRLVLDGSDAYVANSFGVLTDG